ncbi:MAG TPA: peptide ABC transporter substrate-binding protein [Gaiellaceae bacterium]|jgi:ABC-type oligopeptide transport system substrate-binding subunit
MGLLALVALALVAAGCGGSGDDTGDGAAENADQVITVNWGTEPPSLDPGLASDTTSANILLNVMDPLVRLGEDLQPVPGVADSWDISENGRKVTLHLRPDARWTNGDPVTAQDYEWSWKRTISPELAADYAYQFFGIVGAADYNSCKSNCAAAREKVGVTAVDDTTLSVELTSPQPWFMQQLAHHSFLAVHRPTVEKYGNQWTEAKNIVTNGPFQLVSWNHGSRIDLAKWEDWRLADQVTLERINGRMISDGITAVQAFEAGELDATGSLPPEELPRLKGTPEYNQYPALGTYYYGINVKQVTDPKQRRAMAMAIDRQAIIDNVAQADQLPATGFTPQGMPGFETINPSSEYLPAEGDMEAAKALMEEVENPKRSITLLINDSPGHREIAVAVQAMWNELGLDTTIKQQEWAQFLEFIGPPPDASIDAFRLGWIADYVDAFNFLELWTCDSGNNSTNYCNPEYDALVQQVRSGDVTSDEARYELYGQLEELMFGEDGDMPISPIYWYTYTQLEQPSIKDTFNINPLDQIDLTDVVEGGGSLEA